MPIGSGRVAILGGFDPSVLRSGLAAYWNLDEASGTRAALVGGHTLADNATVTSNPGKYGLAGQFTATNGEYLSVANHADFEILDTAFTINGWMYLDSVDATRTMASVWTQDGSQRAWTCGYESTNVMRFSVSADGATTAATAQSAQTAAASAWHMLTAWHDPGADRIFCQMDLNAPGSAAHSTGVFDSSADFRIGAVFTTVAASLMDGRIDNVGIWRRLLSAREKAWLWKHGAGRAVPWAA